MKNRLYIFGGYDGIQRLNDFYYYVLSEQRKNRVGARQEKIIHAFAMLLIGLTLGFTTRMRN